MEIKKSDLDEVFVLELSGRLEATTSASFETELSQLIDASHKKIVVDFSGVTYMTSSGLRALLVAGRKIEELGGKLVLCSLRDHVKNVFDVAGFAILFDVYPEKLQAVEALR